MKTIRNFTLYILHFTLAFATANAKTFDVDVSTGKPAASNEAYYHGETIEFRAVRGRSVVTNVEYSCVYYQTNGMGDVWWKTDGLVFHPTNDVGAASYRFFMEGRDDLGRDWHANGLLRLLHSPGFTPNEITMPVATLDFSGIEVLNAPWPEEIEAVARVVASNELAIAETARQVASNELAIASTARGVASNELAIAETARQVASKLDAEEYTPTREIPVGLYRLESPDDDPAMVSADNLVLEGVGTYVRPRSKFEISEDSVGFIIKAVLAPARNFSYGNLSTDEYADSTGVPIRFAIGDIISIQDSLGFPDYMCMASNVVQELPPVLMTLGQSISNVVTKSYVEDLGISADFSTNNTELVDTIAATKPSYSWNEIGSKPSFATVATSGSYNDLSNKPTIPTVPTNVSAFNNDAGYLTGYTESDPTISAWAKQPTKPSYTASEVGAVPTSRTVNGKALSANISLTASDVGAATTSALNTLSSQVTAISGHLNAEDARFVSTNYNSQVHLPEASVEVSVSNEWLTVWREMTRWDAFVGSGFDWTSWGGFLSWMSTTEAALDQKADRAWGYYDSHTGEWAPEGYTQVSSSNILIAAGMGYQRTVSSGHTYWVLTANEPYEVSGISSNGFFRVADADGNVQFEIIKGDKRTVPAPPDGVSASGGVLTVSYPVASQPTVEVSLTLADGGTWYAEDSASCPATVAWSGTSGAYVATVTPSAPTAQLFVKASYQVGGETFINNRAPISITGGIYFNGTLYMPTVSGNELKFIAQ